MNGSAPTRDGVESALSHISTRYDCLSRLQSSVVLEGAGTCHRG
jgi:hypothetical protein